MDFAARFTLALAALNIALLVLLSVQRGLVRERLGRILLLLAALGLPTITVYAAVNVTLQKSRKITFCMSCHEMQAYGESLKADDDEMLPAVHFQNNLVARDDACYQCHSDYSMFGPLKAKLNGLRHVYVHYLGTPPEHLKLYKPFDTAICMHCHEGARSLLTNKAHRSEPGLIEAFEQGRGSCLQSGCHDVTHEVGAGDD